MFLLTVLVAQFRNCCVNHNQLGLKCSQLHLFWWLSSLYWEVRFRKNISKFLHNDVKKSFLEFQFVATFVCWESLPSLLRGEQENRKQTEKKLLHSENNYFLANCHSVPTNKNFLSQRKMSGKTLKNCFISDQSWERASPFKHIFSKFSEFRYFCDNHMH